jgi:hypothetical protein
MKNKVYIIPGLNDTVCIQSFTVNLQHINGPYYLAKKYGYTIVEFISIHFGEEFIPCRDCLSHVIPSNRVQIGPDNTQFL